MELSRLVNLLFFKFRRGKRTDVSHTHTHNQVTAEEWSEEWVSWVLGAKNATFCAIYI